MKKYAVTVLNALAVFAALLLLWQGLDLLLHLPALYAAPAAGRRQGSGRAFSIPGGVAGHHL